MRTLPAILLAALTALVIIASAVLTTQFGMHDWPTPPLPDTATRLVTPTEAAGRATSKVTEDEDGGDAAGLRAAATPHDSRRDDAGRSRRPSRDRAPSVRRDGGTPAEQPARAGRGGDPEPAGDDGATETDSGSAPVPPDPDPAPAPVEDEAPVIDAGSGEDAQARPQDDAAPEPTLPAVPDEVLPAPGDEAPGERRGPIRHLLEDAFRTP